MKLDQDRKQKITITVLFMLEFYRVLMGTFLTIFVPQQCSNDDVCTITENIFTDNTLHQISNGIHCATFLCMIMFYYKELRRELWSIKYLDIEDDKANTHLDEEIENYQDIKKMMTRENREYLLWTKIANVAICINIIVSIVVLSESYAGVPTLTSGLSYVLLLVMKMNSAYGVAKTSLLEDKVKSAFMLDNKVYNTIDVDYRRKPETKICGEEGENDREKEEDNIDCIDYVDCVQDTNCIDIDTDIMIDVGEKME